jgi:hypothetical protein
MGVMIVDEIEVGFEKIMQKITELKEKDRVLSEKIRNDDAAILGRMAQSSIPIVKSIGLAMLEKGKQDTKGEIYNASYYPKKMIILGKSEPSPFRPDNPAKKVTDQFCVLSEEGTFSELMYSSDGFFTDSFLNPIDPKTALDLYGYDVIYMLYKAMHDYLKDEQVLVDALEMTILYVFPQKNEE